MSEERQYSGITCDMTGVITEFGPGAEKLFGYTKDELIGLRYDALRRFYFRPKYVLRQLRHVKKDPTSFFKLSYGLVKAVEKVLLPNIGFANNKKGPIILHQ